jgi:hypothetical protein
MAKLIKLTKDDLYCGKFIFLDNFFGIKNYKSPPKAFAVKSHLQRMFETLFRYYFSFIFIILYFCGIVKNNAYSPLHFTTKYIKHSSTTSIDILILAHIFLDVVFSIAKTSF